MELAGANTTGALSRAVIAARLRALDVRDLDLRHAPNGIERLRVLAAWCALDVDALAEGATGYVSSALLQHVTPIVAELLAELPDHRALVLRGRCCDA